MKNKGFIKMAAFLTAGILTVSSAYAQDKDYSLIINGEKTENAQIFEGTTDSGENTLFIPLRAICEELGFTVNWDSEIRRVELVKLPTYITFYVDADGYTFAKTAPMKLGAAPKIIEGRTYVPVNFIDEIIGGKLDMNEDKTEISVLWGENNNAVVYNEVTFEEKEKDGRIIVKDLNSEEIILNITEETVIKNAKGEKAELEGIEKGDLLKVRFGDIMTASIPAQTNAVEIIIADKISATSIPDDYYTKANFVEVDELGRVLINNFIRGDILLNITDETVIRDEDGKALQVSDLTADKELKVKFSDAMTMSLPPQTNAFEIIVTKNDAPIVKEGVVSENSDGTVVVGTRDDIENFFALNLSEDTVVINELGETLKASDIKEGTKISASVSQTSTRSIPPQHSAYVIRIEK